MINLSAEIIANGVTYEIRNLSSIEFSGQDRSNASQPSWGIISNSGSLEMYDLDGIIQNLNKNSMLLNSRINIYLNAPKRREQIGGFYICDYITDRQSLKTTIKFKDTLESWTKKQLPFYIYPYTEDSWKYSPVNAVTILGYLRDKANITLEYANESTQNHLANLRIKCPMLSAGSLWNQANKVCELSSCYIFCDNKGSPTIYYNGGA